MNGAKFTMKILRDFDSSSIDELKRRAGLAGERVAKVGVPAGPEEADGTSIAKIAAIHEFGAPEANIPERPFMRTAIRENRERLVRLNRRNLVRVLEGQISPEKALGELGNMAAGAVKAEIRNGEFVPLKPETIKRKGSSKPLIDKGQMIQSVTYAVEDK